MKQLFVNIIGHNASGKTTLAKKLAEDLGLNRVSGDAFREFIHEQVLYFHDTDSSFPNERYDELSPLVMHYRFELTSILLKAKQGVIFDGSGSTREFRSRYLSKVRSEFPEVKKAIIWATLDESELLERLKQRGGNWQRQYEEIKRHSFEPPQANEADLVLLYSQNNYDEIKMPLEKLLQ